MRKKRVYDKRVKLYMLNQHWLKVRQQFYLSATIPWKGGDSIRLQAIWAITELGDAPVPESTALNLAIGEMQKEAEIVEAWLDNQ